MPGAHAAMRIYMHAAQIGHVPAAQLARALGRARCAARTPHIVYFFGLFSFFAT
jgi:hypothetical protein